ncbi:OPT oligopeptide transporter protein-domain-containing protein [Blyttiomyces helicus]|uniref:OPT oligopeptide transporter protein-domain-containing protein n=1 Tax=Blyttiomyces helicus TaxID=388810 RepID=A0A4P9W265_9FUNG|nr:OPT oligopeptide transporter protein-domain-containing protein [Blyttiomyces helicus]|eukprot:RKO84868.1 OPT oligopeptide transporter protein-domain-containing protein [Blyttiomyces helicus]
MISSHQQDSSPMHLRASSEEREAPGACAQRLIGGSLNPGPYNIKEHSLIMVAASTNSGPAYATDILAIQRLFYGPVQNPYKPDPNGVNVGWCIAFFLIITTQCVGYGFSGLCRNWLVTPAAMWYPGNIVLANLLHVEYTTSTTTPYPPPSDSGTIVIAIILYLTVTLAKLGGGDGERLRSEPSTADMQVFYWILVKARMDNGGGEAPWPAGDGQRDTSSELRGGARPHFSSTHHSTTYTPSTAVAPAVMPGTGALISTVVIFPIEDGVDEDRQYRQP